MWTIFPIHHTQTINALSNGPGYNWMGQHLFEKSSAMSIFNMLLKTKEIAQFFIHIKIQCQTN